MKRTFIAVKINAGEKLTGMISDIRSLMKNDSVRWVDINNMHITLAFLGDTSEETIRQVCRMLDEKCGGFTKVVFSLKGIGVFRNINDPRVIWAGIKNAEKLSDLQKSIKSGLDALGIETEEREFRPHLTVGRIKRINNRRILGNIVSEYDEEVFQEVEISEVLFYESILQEEGPEYLVIRKVGL